MSGVIIGPGIVLRPRSEVPRQDRAPSVPVEAAPRHDSDRHPADQASRLRELIESANGARQRSQVAASAPARTCPVVAVTSGKGGVGKTSLSVNLSVALAGCKVRPTLLDADLGLANADVLCGITPTTRLDAAVEAQRHGERRTLDEIAVQAPGGFRLVPGSVGVARMANLSPLQRSILVAGLTELEAQSDVVLIDTAAGLSESVTSFVAAADLTLVVITPEPTSIADAYALMKCVSRECPAASSRFACIVNMAENIGEAHAVHARVSATAKRFLGFEPPMLGFVPRDEAVRLAVRSRSPFTISAPKSDAAIACSTLAVALARRLRIPHVVRQQPGRGLFGWLKGR